MKNKATVPIIYFHSIGPVNVDWKKNFLTVDASIFEKQLIWLKKRFNSIFLKEYWLIRQGLNSQIKNPIIITFDDGYLDNWIWAFPLLKKHGLKATIFVSPEYVDKQSGLRPNLNDYVKGKVTLSALTRHGFLSWEEMMSMEESGLIDIQSHTMTHTKYFVSDELVEFHHPGSDSLYYISNKFPEKKPYYVTDINFETLLPFGYPVFKSMSSILARKIEINPEFINVCLMELSEFDFKSYSFKDAYAIVKPVYNKFRQSNDIIIKRESYQEYIDRLRFEIITSKEIIEKNLRKKVEFLCWPFGDNNEVAHKTAIEAGYLMTTIGNNSSASIKDQTRLPTRIGMNISTKYNAAKTSFKLRALSGIFPYSIIFQTFTRY